MATPASSDEMPGNNDKPLLFFTALPGEGHTYPLITIAASMIKRGYQVIFHGGSQFETEILAIGAEFSPVPSMLDPVPDPAAVLAAGQAITDPGIPTFVHGLTNFLYDTMPLRTQLLDDALAALRERHPATRQIIVVHELCSMNVLPFAYGRPPPRGFATFPRTIGIGAANIMAPSSDTAPFGMGLPYDTSRPCILRNRELHKLADQGPWRPLFESAERALRAAGATAVPAVHPFATWYDAPDVCFQMCSRGMEYPLSDMPPKIRFAGCLPPRESSGNKPLPGWWDEVVSNAGGKKKKIVFVSQGTAHVDYSQLVLPTMEAFRDRDDILVVATLGIKGAQLGEDVDVPRNARWTDYLAYDRILPLADVFVANAGYGSAQHAVTNGVPAVLAGELLDKKEVTLRAVYAGLARDLESAAPSVSQIREGVEAVLADGRFKERAMELKRENEAMDCMGVIERQIVEFTE